ncbi:MAG: thioredoxin family protein [Muribaculaceae bacterium]|nr:thioredoxin family protein [Muribaculaceae bacterium]
MSNTKTQEVEKALLEAKPTLVEFYTSGETHSEETLPVVAELKTKVSGKANVITVDTATNEELVKKYHIHSVPTWIIFSDGQEAWRTGGRLPLKELEDMVNRFV